MKRYQFVSMGELLMDFIPTYLAGYEQPCYLVTPGGSPANVAGVLAYLGWKTAFVGKVGKDVFGE